MWRRFRWIWITLAVIVGLVAAAYVGLLMFADEFKGGI